LNHIVVKQIESVNVVPVWPRGTVEAIVVIVGVGGTLVHGRSAGRGHPVKRGLSHASRGVSRSRTKAIHGYGTVEIFIRDAHVRNDRGSWVSGCQVTARRLMAHMFVSYISFEPFHTLWFNLQNINIKIHAIVSPLIHPPFQSSGIPLEYDRKMASES